MSSHRPLAEIAAEMADALKSAHEDQTGSTHQPAICPVCQLLDECEEAIANV